jgi:hypothetical protein
MGQEPERSMKMPEDGSDDGGTGGTGDDGTNGAAGAGASGGGDAAAGNVGAGGTNGAAGQQQDAQDVSALPDWAQKLIKDTRGEAASNRTAKTQAEKDKADMLSKIGQALGLTKDERPDPCGRRRFSLPYSRTLPEPRAIRTRSWTVTRS